MKEDKIKEMYDEYKMLSENEGKTPMSYEDFRPTYKHMR